MWKLLKRRKRLFLVCGLLLMLVSGGMLVRDAARPRLNHPKLIRGVFGQTTEAELEKLLGHPGTLVSGSRTAGNDYVLQWDDGELFVRAAFQKDGTLKDMATQLRQKGSLINAVRNWLGF